MAHRLNIIPILFNLLQTANLTHFLNFFEKFISGTATCIFSIKAVYSAMDMFCDQREQ